MKLQGYRRNDRNVKITMNVTIGHDESFTDFFWIIQRKYIVYEGDEECPEDDDDNCYYAKRRRRIRGGKKNEYQITRGIVQSPPRTPEYTYLEQQ